MANRAQEIPRQLRELVGDGELPTLPVVIQEGLRLLGDEQVALREVGELVATDPVLGGRILRLVNSSLIGLRRPMASIADAVVYLGTDQVRNLLLSTSVVSALDDGRTDLEPFWQHAFGCGYVGSRLAPLLGVGPADDIYLAGLCHDLGRILLVLRCAETYRTCRDAATGPGPALLDAERSSFGLDHCEVGAILAAHWRFPERIVEVVRHHHAPDGAGEFRAETALVRLADYLCWSRGLIDIEEDLEPTDLEENECWTILAEHAGGSEMLDPHRLLHEADTMVHTARTLVQSVYEPAKAVGG